MREAHLPNALLSTALALCLPAVGLAQDDAQQDTAQQDTTPRVVYQLEELRVEVTRRAQRLFEIPLAVSVISKDQIQTAERGFALEESLRGIPGVFAQNRRNLSVAGGARINIRGIGSRFGMRGIQVLVDGIPLTMADGTVQPTNIDLSSIGRVEVIRGPSSALYGNAAGGVISYHTEFPARQRLVGEPQFQAGSHGYMRGQMKASGALEDGRFQYLVSGNWSETDGFREYGAAEVWHGNVFTRYRFSERTELRSVFNIYHMPFGENASFLTREDAANDPESVRGLAIDQGWGESATQGQGGFNLRHDLGEAGELRGTAWGMWREIWNPIPFRVIDLSRLAGGVRSEYRGGIDVGTVPVQWITGVDLSVQNDDRKEFENAGVPAGGDETREGAPLQDQRERVIGVGPFAQLELEFVPRWRLTLAARYDAYEYDVDDFFQSDGDDSGSRTLTEFSPMVGLSWTPVDAVSFYGNYATAFETPTTVELSNRPSGQGGFNPDLDPEDVESFELGARGRVLDGRAGYDIAAYIANVDGALIQFEGAEEQTFFRNAGELSRKGLEVGLNLLPIDPIEVQLAYTYQDFEFDEFVTADGDFTGNRQPAVADHQAFAGLVHRAPFGLRSELNVRWVNAFPVNNENTIFNPSYRVVDVRFSLDRRVGRVRIRPFLGIDNLFDERYNASAIPNAFGDRFFEPAPGTEIYAGITVPLSPARTF